MTTQTKFTPGPWSVYRNGAIHGGSFHEYTNGSAQEQVAMVCVLQRSDVTDPAVEQSSNAALIAAAPDLYAALEALLHETEPCTHESTHRGGAIWTICDECDEKWADDDGGFKPYEDTLVRAAARSALRKARGEA